jgi:DNA-directed RNA polymerase subunit RPC12/RpoP
VHYNDLRVTVRDFDGYNYKSLNCKWLGHSSYMCGNCKRGVIKMYGKYNKGNTKRCPECEFEVVIIDIEPDPKRSLL